MRTEDIIESILRALSLPDPTKRRAEVGEVLRVAEVDFYRNFKMKNHEDDFPRKLREMIDLEQEVIDWIGAPTLAWPREALPLFDEYHQLLKDFILSDNDDLHATEGYKKLKEKWLAQRAKFEADPRYKDLFGQMGH